jgi:hypothetical protein
VTVPVFVKVALSEVSVLSNVRVKHGCGGSVWVGPGAWVCWRVVEFPKMVTNCVTVDVVLGANTNEVCVSQ